MLANPEKFPNLFLSLFLWEPVSIVTSLIQAFWDMVKNTSYFHAWLTHELLKPSFTLSESFENDKMQKS